MRNSTKIKHLLQLYALDFFQDDDGLITMTIHNKTTGFQKEFSATKYWIVIDRAYRYMDKITKDVLNTIENPE